jgi:mono/diheme cytochrome c family protein
MRLIALSCFVVALAWGQNVGLLQQAPPKSAAKANPMDGNERARLAGAKLYVRECAPCHGMSAEGSDKVPPLKRANVSHAPAGALFWVLENGSLYHGMPSFAHLPPQQRWQIITYLQRLSEPAKPEN